MLSLSRTHRYRKLCYAISSQAGLKVGGGGVARHFGANFKLWLSCFSSFLPSFLQGERRALGCHFDLERPHVRPTMRGWRCRDKMETQKPVLFRSSVPPLSPFSQKVKFSDCYICCALVLCGLPLRRAAPHGRVCGCAGGRVNREQTPHRGSQWGQFVVTWGLFNKKIDVKHDMIT